MTTVVELEVPADRLGAARAFDRVPSFELRIGGIIGTSPPLVWTSGPDRLTIKRALESDPSVEVLASLTDGTGRETDDDCWLFQLEFGDDMKLFQQIVSESDGTILAAHGQDGRWSLKLLFTDHKRVSECHDRFAQYDFRVTVTRVSGTNDITSARTPLTSTQYEAIYKAYELGYFDVPRRITLEELADELDVSHQALSERLRRSHAALVDAELSAGMTPLQSDP
ncbi:helix-turn-helix domain-containing protein [Halosolutus gelatinilyticus]|uniref:helix-turn-helix domain-containing protein n=1 Tax=Halosolutus gelatinilyticus TaxID=2931975 RepID=UPI001FF2537C|nr:helix-turn-helix domain-containing protein [Halosolutus gelatinilyticus]